MESKAASIFEEGLTRAEKAYSTTFEEEKGGVGTWLTTWGEDWKKHIESALARAREMYMQQVDMAIDKVAEHVDTQLATARQRVAEGRKEVQDFVNKLDKNVRQFGQEALETVAAEFDAMAGEIDERAEQLIGKLVDQYKASSERMSAMEEKFRDENKSLWDRVRDATVGVVEKILAFNNMLLGILGKAAGVIKDIIDDPIGFLKNLVSSIGQGLKNFMGRIATHLQKGLMGWLFGALGATGLQLPDTFDLKGIISIVLQVLGLTYANFRARAVAIVGEPVVAKLEKTVEVFKVLITEGITGLWRFIKEKVGDLKAMIFDTIFDFIRDKVIIAGIKWIIGLLNPASAFFKACMAIYDIVMFFIERGSQIIELVNAVINSITSIAKGALSAAIEFVEGALAKAIPVTIGFLAGLLGLGDISGTVRKTIDKAQKPINTAIDWVINLAVKGLKKLGGLFGFGKKKDKEGKPDERTQEMKRGDLTRGLSEAQMLLENKNLTTKEIKEKLPAIKSKYGITIFELVADSKSETEETDHVHGEIHSDPVRIDSGKVERNTFQGEKPENWEEVQKVVGKKVGVKLPPGYTYFEKDNRKFIRRDVADDKKYQRLGVDLDGNIVVGAGISPAEALRSEAEMREHLGPAEAGKERHHLIPLSIAASHDLVKKAIEKGDPPYQPNSGLIFLPRDEGAAKQMPGLPIHSGSHPRWTNHVGDLLTAELTALVEAFGSLNNVPGKTLTAAVMKVQIDLGAEIRSWKKME
jgi:hypothetical protein